MPRETGGSWIGEESRPELMVRTEQMFMSEGGGSNQFRGTPLAVFDLLVEGARPFFEEASDAGTVRPGVTVDDAVEFICRMLFSLLAMPGRTERDPSQLREFLRA
jgi:hypothetical protein